MDSDKYKNHTIPEGINVSQEHPLKDFVFMALGLGLLTLLLVFSLSLGAGFLVRFIPFSLEKEIAGAQLADRLEASVNYEHGTEAANDTEHKLQAYLQSLANQLAKAQGLDDEMSISVHYVDDATVNGFATLGGHIFLHRGLLEKLPHENALAMLIAHEIAHIKHRDPIMALGRGVVVGLALTSLSGIGDGAFANQLINNVSLLTMLSFSREQESAADEAAILTLKNHYGHSHGAEALFEVLQQEQKLNPPELLSTHPVTEDRITFIQSRSLEANAVNETKPLPEWFAQALTN